MITLREAASGLLSVVEAAIESGDWEVDGACDPAVEIIRLKNALAKPWVGLTDEEIEQHFFNNVDTGSLLSFGAGAAYAETKLKEKNT